MRESDKAGRVVRIFPLALSADAARRGTADNAVPLVAQELYAGELHEPAWDTSPCCLNDKGSADVLVGIVEGLSSAGTFDTPLVVVLGACHGSERSRTADQVAAHFAENPLPHVNVVSFAIAA